MAYFRTCRTCVLAKAACPIRWALTTALVGLRVTSVKHRCAAFRPVFEPGQPVEVLTVAWINLPKDHPDWEGDEPPRHWYPAHFIRWTAGGQPIVFVRAGARPVNAPEGDEFEPRGQGFVRAALYRVRPSTWAEPMDVAECRQCGAILTLGQPCGYDRYNFHTKPHCRQEQLGLNTPAERQELPVSEDEEALPF